ncbi:MAG: GGDEF domain-containing protein [Dehalococcoidia bacterium]
MNRPSGLNAFLFPAPEKALGSVRTPPLIRVLRPISFALWLVIFCVQAITIIATGDTSAWPVVVISTIPFVILHTQFWYEESEQGRRFHHVVERIRGRIYEDELTGLPNARHFVFELRRQMMRSVRNGRGFSLVLTDMAGLNPQEDPKALPAIGRAIRHTCSEGDFVAHLEGPVFAAIVVDDDRAGSEKAEALQAVLGGLVPGTKRGAIVSIVSLTGYQGELEVRDFLRRAQRDLLAGRARVPGTPSAAPTKPASAPAA